MTKVSVIIPTLWRSDVTTKLVKALLNWHLLEELIIIDNDPSSRPRNECWQSCTVLEQRENIYVNPAWNLGVSQSKGEVIAICNDDICFNPNDLNAAIEKLKYNEVIGLHEDAIVNSQSISEPELHSSHVLGQGWGCLMLLRRKSYTPIPSCIKVWFGDNWIVHSTKTKLSLRICVEGTLSESASDPKFNPIKEQDEINYNRIIWHPIYRSLRILCKIGIKLPLKQILKFNLT